MGRRRSGGIQFMLLLGRIVERWWRDFKKGLDDWRRLGCELSDEWGGVVWEFRWGFVNFS